MNSIKIYSFILLLLIPLIGSSQKVKSLDSNNTKRHFPTLRLNYGHATVIATNDFLRTENANQAPITQQRNISGELLFQTTGSQDWHQLFGFPKLGLGIQQSWYPETIELGNPSAVYAIFESPIHRWKNSQLDWGFHFGLNLNWNPYDATTNPNNAIIGSWATFYAHLGIIYHQNLGKRFGADLSLGFSHGSNGAVKMPNYGINIFDPRIALTYNMNAQKPELKPKELGEFKAFNEVSISLAMGTKQLDVTGGDSTSQARFGGQDFTIYNVVLLYNRKISRLSKLGAGIDFTVDPADNANGLVHGDHNSTYPPSFSEKMKWGLLLSYELRLNKLALILQPGFYFYRTTHDPKPFFYQRVGVRYDVYKGFNAGASLRAVNFGQADWVEFTIGYKVQF